MTPMNTSTLTSLAILKVTLDQRRDYLDYLRPFLQQILRETSPQDRITPADASASIQERFGLIIPERTSELILRRLSRSLPTTRESGAYRVRGEIPDPDLTARQEEAERHILAIVEGLAQFSKNTAHPLQTEDESVEAVMAFLSEFDVSCLRAYLRGTVIPSLEGTHVRSMVLVSDFVKHIQATDPILFRSFVILVQGHMLANALVCPDLEHITKDYRDVTFYLDTPILVRLLGLEGDIKAEAARYLVELLMQLNATIAVFDHSQDELRSVILNSADYLDSPLGSTPIVAEAKRLGRTRSDLLLAAQDMERSLGNFGIVFRRTPRYDERFQIDESLFEQVLSEWLDYRNPRARLYDINSVRSIYAIRAHRSTPSLERARAVLVTTNSSFAKAAWTYGQRYESSRDVSSVISEFTLANAAWLKAPLGALNVPKTQLLSFAYAALEPSPELLEKYFVEIDRLENEGTFSTRDLELLRSSPSVYPELMGVTLGDSAAIDEGSVRETLQRVSDEIRAEEQQLLDEERQAHMETQHTLGTQESQHEKLLGSIYWRASKLANTLAWSISVALTALVVVGLILGLLLQIGWLQISGVNGWAIIGVSSLLTILALANLVLGLSVRGLHGLIHQRCLGWFIKMESKSLGIDLSESIETSS